LSGITEDCVRIGRVSAGIKEGTVGVFCGNLSANKRLDFLFEAATLVHQAIPEFQLLLLGNGPLCEHVKIVAARNRFIRYIGPRIGVEKALFLKMSDLFLLPGAVGLAVLDAFAAGLPLLTTELPDHGPEVGYLENGRNGLITAHDPKVYAQSVIDLLRDRTRREQLSQAACESGHRHSIEAMVQNFRHGIQECLALPAMRGVPALGAANLLRRSKPLSDRPL
jgi:glycosyltransferase involved in cell wall biosynthesis